MIFKKIISACIALCLMATFTVAMSGCEDLGVYEDVEEYYNSFGDIVLISGTSKEVDEYSVEKYFYNNDSRENFFEGEDGAYKGIEYSDYVYMAIPFESSVVMDTLALYMRAQSDVSVYINVFVTDKIPTAWKAIEDNVINNDETDEVPTDSTDEVSTDSTDELPNDETDELPNDATDELPNDETGEATDETDETEGTDETGKVEKVYDDPKPETRIGEITVHLKNGKWNSFVIDSFRVNGTTQKSIKIEKGQYILLQIRNNSGVRIFDDKKQSFVDPQTGLELQKAKITMTNLLIRALEIEFESETQGGE